MLSVLLITYNHAKYVEKALDSIFMQDYMGEIEFVVGDDKSTDNTLDIIRRYEGKDPRFKFKYLDENLNVGTTKNYKRCFPECTGEYVAIIEGDDYWTSPSKLSRMIEFLEHHRECSMVAHNYYVYLEDEKRFYPRLEIGKSFRCLGARDLISDNVIGNFSTCMYRTQELHRLPSELFDVISYDWIINIIVGTENLLGFIDEPMSVYRVHPKGVWSQSTNIEKLHQCLNMIPVYNNLTDKVFEKEFLDVASKIERDIVLQTMTIRINKKGMNRVLGLIKAVTPPLLIKFLMLLLPPGIVSLLKKGLS